jgi:hypothetical protein
VVEIYNRSWSLQCKVTVIAIIINVITIIWYLHKQAKI